MKEAKIKDCVFAGCSYNENEMCYAPGIAIGDGDHPRCDTFVEGKTKVKGGDIKTMGKVQSCQVKKCSNNVSLKCTADNVTVGFHEQHPYCLTFSMK